ncbi:MAG: HD domain-containing protein [Pleurocapsa minor GSE-CHR-MK-17-07R]|jgi:hypothetical protein|nr:HD domain-containing protein [Pleurocapsa minor GSE-CHR-MK 17-07R]
MYRLRQGTRALFAQARPLNLALAEQHLSPAELALFRAMTRSEQIHSISVLRSIQSDGQALPPALAAAALLHDCGKSLYPMRLWQRSLPVLVRRALPRLYRRLAGANPRALLTRGFAVVAHHPAWGAELLSKAGSSADTVWLVAHHADPLEQWGQHPLFHSLQRLRRADDTN